MGEIRKLISRWHRDELGAEHKAAQRKCSKALAPILDIIRKNAGSWPNYAEVLEMMAPKKTRPATEAASQSQIVISKTTCSRLTKDMRIHSGRSYVVNLSAYCAAIVVI